MFLIYDILITGITLFFLPYILIKIIYKQNKEIWLERLGYIDLPLTGNKYIWIHCASVGEINIVRIFISELVKLFPEYKIVLSVITPTGKKVANESNLPVEKIFYFPFDISFIINRIVKRLDPVLLILVETELWPNLIRYTNKNYTKIMVINGRISSKSYSKYKFFKFFIKKILKNIDLFLMREENDRTRIINLGAEKTKVFVTGNMKYDIIKEIQELSITKSDFGFNPNDKIFVAGSIREGEEEKIVNAYEKARKELFGYNLNLKMIIAPRHLNRTGIIEKLIQSKDIKYTLKTKLKSTNSNFDCIILDTYGELINAYSIADIIFVGGSLVRTGGQNIIEPAMLSKLVMFGPHMESFSEPANLLKATDSAVIVNSSDELSKNIVFYIKNEQLANMKGKKAKSVVMSMRGVTEKNMYHIKNLLKYNFNRILIIQPSRLGDVIFSLPVLASLRKMYPDAYISWAIDERCKELISGNPDLNDIIIIPFKSMKKDLKELKIKKIFKTIFDLKKILREKKFDLTIDLHGLAKSAFIVLLTNSKYKLASTSSYGMKELSWLFSKEIHSTDENRKHCIDRHLAVIDYLNGIKIKKFFIETTESDKIYINNLINNMNLNFNNLVIIFPGGGWRSRRWFPERFAELSDRLIYEYKFDIIFIGGPASGSEEKGIIEKIMSNMSQKSYNLSNKLTLKQLFILLSKSKLFIGNEAGPMHLACISGIPVVGIIGPTNPGRTGPFGNNFIIVRKEVYCAPCKERNCKKMDCMKLIKVDDVLEATKKILKLQ